MKKIFLISFSIFGFFHLFGQKSIKTFDIIIVVDGNIIYSGFTDLKIEVVGKKQYSFDAKYYPGNFSIIAENYNELISDSTNGFYLEFDYQDYSDGEQKIYRYEIPINKKWLVETFFILKIYNVDKKINRAFKPLKKGYNYNFEIVSPNCTFFLVRSKI